MKFAIVGAGALGTILGSHLDAAGHEVTMIARGARLRQIRTLGLRLSGLNELHRQCTALSAAEVVDEYDCVVYAVKTYQMAAAVEATKHIQAQAVFSVANGVQKNELLASAFGIERTLGCMADFSGELKPDGTVVFTRNIFIHIGTLSEHSHHADGIAEAIHAAGVNTQSVSDVRSVEWSKYVGWVAMFSLAIISRLNTGHFLSQPAFAAIAYDLIGEMREVASSYAVSLDGDSPLPVAVLASADREQAIELLTERGRNLLENAPDHRMSSLQDLERGTALEYEETLGFARNIAQAEGISTPTLDVCYNIAAGLNASVIST
ncbi:MAG: 2-dehydropantoate 2-reductase N-terminal domain-containing protein [Pseudomonadota bacterium]